MNLLTRSCKVLVKFLFLIKNLDKIIEGYLMRIFARSWEDLHEDLNKDLQGSFIFLPRSSRIFKDPPRIFKDPQGSLRIL